MGDWAWRPAGAPRSGRLGPVRFSGSHFDDSAKYRGSLLRHTGYRWPSRGRCSTGGICAGWRRANPDGVSGHVERTPDAERRTHARHRLLRSPLIHRGGPAGRGGGLITPAQADAKTHYLQHAGRGPGREAEGPQGPDPPHRTHFRGRAGAASLCPGSDLIQHAGRGGSRSE